MHDHPWEDSQNLFPLRKLDPGEAFFTKDGLGPYFIVEYDGELPDVQVWHPYAATLTYMNIHTLVLPVDYYIRCTHLSMPNWASEG
jgi:hypothetical protein